MIPGRTHEFPHNTPEQVRAYLREALVIMDELDVPDDLRQVVVVKLMELIGAKQIAIEAIQPGVPNMVVPRGL